MYFFSMAHDGLDSIEPFRKGDFDHYFSAWSVNGVVGGDKQSLAGNLYSCGPVFRGLQPETEQNSFELPFLYPLVSLILHEFPPFKTFGLPEAAIELCPFPQLPV